MLHFWQQLANLHLPAGASVLFVAGAADRLNELRIFTRMRSAFPQVDAFAHATKRRGAKAIAIVRCIQNGFSRGHQFLFSAQHGRGTLPGEERERGKEFSTSYTQFSTQSCVILHPERERKPSEDRRRSGEASAVTLMQPCYKTVRPSLRWKR